MDCDIVVFSAMTVYNIIMNCNNFYAKILLNNIREVGDTLWRDKGGGAVLLRAAVIPFSRLKSSQILRFRNSLY